MKKILAIGCGGAGMFSLIVASQLKKGKFETTVLSDEADIYCRCTTPYILTGEAMLKEAIQPESMVGDYGVKIIHDKALAIDPSKKQVTAASGRSYDYDYLVIATGASPVRPPIIGIDLPGVHTIRSSENVKEIYASAKKNKKVAVIGAGVIGIEMAGALRARGLEVTLIEAADRISTKLADYEFSKKIIDQLTASGVKVQFDTQVKSIVAKKTGSKELVLENHGKTTRLAADLVIVAAGIKPNLEIIKGTKIKADRRGIIVDRKMRTNLKDIYACGDCCVPISGVTGEHQPSSLASSAIQQSKIVGYQIAGFPIKYAGATGAFAFKTLGKEFAGVGLTETEARQKFKWVLIGRAVTTDVYNDLTRHLPLEVKLVFAGPKLRLVGFQAFGNGLISPAEVASFGIGLHLSILKMLRFNYIAHPSLTAWPFMNPIIMATEDAMGNLMKKLPFFKK